MMPKPTGRDRAAVALEKLLRRAFEDGAKWVARVGDPARSSYSMDRGFAGFREKHFDAIGELLVAPQEAAQGWRDIGTAPKDGSNVILWCVDLTGAGGHVATGSWHDPYGGSWWDWNMEYTLHPTHWQPLPPAPQEAKK